MKEYRITITPEAAYDDFWWEWKVFYGSTEVGHGTGYWRWIARRKAKKFAKKHSEGKIKGPKTYQQDFLFRL